MYMNLSLWQESAKITDSQPYTIGDLQFAPPHTHIHTVASALFFTAISILKAAEYESVITMATLAAGQEMCMKHNTDESCIMPKVL